mgnify:CR=1 FL=1
MPARPDGSPEKYNVAEERLTGRRSWRLLVTTLAIIVGATFLAEVVIMLTLPRLLPEGTGQLAEILLDATLLSLALGGVVLPLLMRIRRRHLREARRALRVQFTLDRHAIVSITDVRGDITFANDRFCEISGYSRAELLGKNHRILKSGLHPQRVYEEMWRTIAQGGVWEGDICNRKKNGGLYWVHATIAPFFDERGKPQEYVAIRTEITAQKDLEKVAKRQEALLQTTLDNLGEGVYTLDAEGRVAYINAEGERLIGWRLDELAGKRLHDIIHHHRPDGRPLPAAECPIHLAMREHRIYRSNDEVFFHKDGTALPVKITGAPLSLGGEWQGSVAVFSDVREERQLQKHLLEAKDAAEAAARLKGDFLSTMSHEIRTPLNGVIGMTDLLLDTPLDTEQTEFARTIKTSADALMAIINDILDFSKIEAGRLTLENTSFSLRQTVEGSLDVVVARAQEKGLTLAGFVAPDVPDHLIGDPTRVRQILLNFLSNAIKFTEAGEVLAQATLEGAMAEGDRITLRLAVRDSGIGLGEAAKHALFRPFSQADSSTTRKYGGTGLGLSICKRLVEAMGGEIGVDSEPGKGATFWVCIPFEVAVENRTEMPPDRILEGKRLLLAGAGGASAWDLYAGSWRATREQAADIADVRKALDRAQRAGQPFDAVLVGGMLGERPLEQAVAELCGAGSAPVICYVAQPDRDLRAALTAVGAIVLQPPIKQSSLAAALAVLSGRARPSMARRAADGSEPAATIEPARVAARLLLAEDNPVNQRVAVHLLGKLGHVVDVVGNGAQAVAAAASGEYALVLMDCQMPEMDGFEATAAIRRSEAGGRHLPIIAMTANALQGDRERCLAAGMDDYIAKPINAIQLEETLAAWLLSPDGDVRAGNAAPTSGRDVAGQETTAIDLSRLTEMFGDDVEVVNELLAVFRESLPTLRSALASEVRDRGARLRRITHELRGSASNVGALRLAELASQIEALADGGAWPEIEFLAARVDAECDRVDNFIQRRLAPARP